MWKQILGAPCYGFNKKNHCSFVNFFTQTKVLIDSQGKLSVRLICRNSSEIPCG